MNVLIKPIEPNTEPRIMPITSTQWSCAFWHISLQQVSPVPQSSSTMQEEPVQLELSLHLLLQQLSPEEQSETDVQN